MLYEKSANAIVHEVRVFLDTSALFAGIWSEVGGARRILKLGEARAVRILVGPQVLVEIDTALREKAPERLAHLALLLDLSEVEITSAPPQASVDRSLELTGHAGDAQVLSSAWESNVDYFVTLDRQHFLSNADLRSALPFPLGTPGDFLAWFRERVKSEGQNG